MAIPPSDTPPDPAGQASSLRRLEERIARIEAHLRLGEAPRAAEPAPESPAPAQKAGEDLEFRIGQEWFAKVGIAALGIGAAFTLSLPYPGLPAAAPSLICYLVAAGLFALAGFCPRQLEPVSGPFRAIAMALLYFAGLRLCFFGSRHALSADSVAGSLILVATAGANLAIAFRRKSPWLFGLALITGYATAVAVSSAGVGLVLVALFSIAAVAASVSLGRPALVLVAMSLAYAAYVAWALDNPFLGRPVQAIAGPPWGPWILLVCMAAFSMGLRSSARGDRESIAANAGIFINAPAGYAIYLLHTLARHEAWFVGDQLAASAVLLALALGHSRERDGVGSFICAMTGFAALSFAIIKATPPPDVFVWLSVQSVIVVATAIWLRSRFIVVANFAIYLGILACYLAAAGQVRWISLGFGVVALVTARLLSWKQERLELRTGIMRNAYLVAAFLIFPYALYHFVPGAWVSITWVGAALLYYLLAAFLHNKKYRWMGHGTLLLTVLYLAVVGISRLEPFFRNLSLLVLGAVLLIVSLVFTKLRGRH
jgi:hypothetical protein